MKKGFVLPLIIGLAFLTTGLITSTSFGQTGDSTISTKSISGGVFYGKVKDPKAQKLKEKEAEYTCVVPGETVEVKFLTTAMSKNPTGYFIKTGIKNKNNGYKIRTNQWIIGRYSGTKTSIKCTLKVTPFTSIPVELETITIYATSKY
ncbi:MAG: hypothetical protein WC662_04150 [Candidatus Paceibacterota bacterium]|jgi:hypothetical protein